MRKIIPAIIAALFLLSVFSCSPSGSHLQETEQPLLSENVESVPEIYGINAEEVAIRNGPGLNFDKLINEKATETLGKPHYRQVDFSTKVELLETKNKWSKIRVVEPEWLSATHIGWIPSEVLISKEDQDKESLGQLDPNDYEILKENHNAAIQNFHVLLNRKSFDKNYVYQFIKAFRKDHCTRNCNVDLYDSKVISNLLDVYPLEDKDYLKVADHLISISTFDATEVRDWYPYQDFHYRELGGKNWKKEPR
jgi:hypothetical protein